MKEIRQIMEYVQLEGIHIHEDGYAKFIELTLFNNAKVRILSYELRFLIFKFNNYKLFIILKVGSINSHRQKV